MGPYASCVGRIPASAYHRVVLYTSVKLHDSVSADLAAGLDNLLQAAVFGTRRILGVPDSVLPKGEPTVSWASADQSLELVAYRDGRIARRSREPLWVGGAATLMLKALDSIDTRAYVTWPASTAPDSVVFDFAFWRPTIDSLGGVTPPKPTRTAVPLVSIAEPWERSVMAAPNQRPPHYPLAARERNYEGMVLLQVLVDTTGHAIESSIHDLWPDNKPRLHGTDLQVYEEFVDESTDAVKDIRFIPATVGGCPVRQLLQMPFTYTLYK